MKTVTSLSEITRLVISTLDRESLQEIRDCDNPDEFVASMYNLIGGWVELYFKLNDPQSRHREFFKKRYGLLCSADMAGLVLRHLYHVANRNYDDCWIKPEILKYREHWIQMGHPEKFIDISLDNV